MTVIVDTREKKCGHVTDYLDAHGIEWQRHKLDCGDYMVVGQDGYSIDRKQNLSEWANCLFAERRRFYDEVRRASASGITLSVLIEHGGQIHKIEDIKLWNNPRLADHPNAVTGRDLMEATYALHIAYRIPIYFCDKRSTGREIIRLLTEAPKNFIV